MKLFKFLKKTKASSFENLLRRAADDPAYRVEFLKRLLTEKLIIITKESIGAEGITILEKDTKVNIYTLQDGSIPVFTSTDRIFDNGIIKDKVNFLELNSRDLFSNIAVGRTFILNPYSDYGKKLLPQEIERLLDGTIFTEGGKQIVIEKSTPVQIGQPAKYPTEVVKSLTRLFSGKPEVNAAYLAWIYLPSSNDPPHYIFAIDLISNWSEISSEAGFLTQEVLGTGEIVDFVQISNRGDINDYFKSIMPFYKKAT
jgi:hypothetical protein